MGHAAQAQQEQRADASTAHPHERPQLELSQGKVDKERIVDWLAGKPVRDPDRRGRFYPAARNLDLTPAERDVIRAAVTTCDWNSGRWAMSTGAIAKESGRHFQTVRKLIGGTGFKGARPGRAQFSIGAMTFESEPPENVDDVDEPSGDNVVMIGRLSELFERRWYSRSEARSEFAKGDRHHDSGLCVKWLRFRTVKELVDFARRRAAKRRKNRALATEERRALVVSTAPENFQGAAVDPGHSPPSDPGPSNLAHSKTRFSGSLSDTSPRTDPLAPPFSDPRESESESEQDDRACGARRPPGGSRAPRALRSALSPSPATAIESTKGGGARSGPRSPAPVPPDVASRVAAIAETFRRELAAAGRRIPPNPAIAATIASRWRLLGLELEEFEAAVYGGPKDPYVVRTATCPWAIVFKDRVSIEAYAHRGRAARDAAVTEALEREAARAAKALAADLGPDAGELARELAELPVAVVQIAAVIPAAPVPTTAEQLAERRRDELAKLASFAELESFAEYCAKNDGDRGGAS